MYIKGFLFFLSLVKNEHSSSGTPVMHTVQKQKTCILVKCNRLQIIFNDDKTSKMNK